MPVKKPALGRGLDALFGPSTATVAEPEPPPVQPPAPPAAPANPELSQASITGGPRQLPIEHITPNPFQPRQDFDPEKLADLVASIREKGILQPLIVRGVKDGHFQIVAGERRWRAAQQAGLRQVPVVIRDFNDLEMTQAAIIENIQRDDLNPIEEARAYETLSNQFGQTQETIAQAVGKSRVAVTNALRLLKLPAEVIEMIQRDILTPGQARPLLALDSSERQLALAREIVTQGLTARDAERLAKGTEELGEEPSSDGSEAPSSPSGKRILPEDIQDLQDKLALHLGMRVRISPKTNKSGKIEVFYSSLDEFHKFCEDLGLSLNDLL